jgi:hypothetical protein
MGGGIDLLGDRDGGVSVHRSPNGVSSAISTDAAPCRDGLDASTLPSCAAKGQQMGDRYVRARFSAEQLRRLHYARFLVKSGLLSEWGGGSEASACFECGAPLRRIWFGPPEARPDGAIFGGQVAYGDDPEFACPPCRRYFGDAGEPYHGPGDPLQLW